MKKLMLLPVLFLLTISVALGVSYPSVHSDGVPISITYTSDYSKFTDTDAVTSQSEAQNPVIMDFSSGTNKKQYVTFSGNQFIFYTLTTSGTFTEIGRESIGDGDDEILRIAGDYNDLSLGSDVVASLIAVIHDTADNDIRVESYSVSATTDEVSSVAYEDIYLQLPDTNTYPLTALDCDYYSTDEVEFLCGYGTTNDHVVTFGSETVDYSSIYHLNTSEELSLKPHSNHMKHDGVFNSVMMSHGTSKEITVVLNPSSSETSRYEQTQADAKVLSIDMDFCVNDECTITPTYYDEYDINYTVATGSASSSDNFDFISNIKGVPYTSFSPGASSDSGKIICFNEKSLNLKSVGNNYPSTRYTCMYDGNIIAQSDEIIPDSLDGGDSSFNGYVSYLPGIVYDVDFDGNLEYCSDNSVLYGGKASGKISCMDINNEELLEIENLLSSSDYLSSDEMMSVMGVANLETNRPYILYYQNSSIVAQNLMNETIDTSFLNPSFSGVYVTDMDSNAEGEILQVKSGTSYLNYETSLDVPELIYDDSLPYDGMFGFYDPASANTTQTFIAQECDYGLNADCTYLINGTTTFDREKLCSYFGTETYTCGDWSYSTPTLDYEFNETGNYGFNVDIYTDDFPSTSLGSFYVEMSVTDEDEGNKEADYIEAGDPDVETPDGDGDDENGDEPSDGIDASDLVNTVNDNIKTIIGLALVVGIIASLASMGIRNPFVLSVAGIIMMIISSILGLISGAILVYVIISIVILIVLQQTVFKSRDND